MKKGCGLLGREKGEMETDLVANVAEDGEEEEEEEDGEEGCNRGHCGCVDIGSLGSYRGRSSLLLEMEGLWRVKFWPWRVGRVASGRA